MNVALIRNNFVESVIVSSLEFAQTLGYDLALQVTPANRVAGGWLIGGVTYLDKPLPAEAVNEKTLRDQALAALDANRADITANDNGIANNDAWLAANTGGNLTTTVLTARVKVLVQHDTAAARQRTAMFRELNGIIRLLLGQLDGTN